MAEDKTKRNRTNQKWKDKNRDRINLLFSKGMKEKIQAAADAAGLSKSQYVEKAILEKIENDG